MKTSTFRKKQFKVIIEHGEDGYLIASVPALPGCHTQGKTLKELTENVKDAIKLCLEEAKENPQYRKQIEESVKEPAFIGVEIVTL